MRVMVGVVAVAAEAPDDHEESDEEGGNTQQDWGSSFIEDNSSPNLIHVNIWTMYKWLSFIDVAIYYM